jgi:hypothetical protein
MFPQPLQEVFPLILVEERNITVRFDHETPTGGNVYEIVRAIASFARGACLDLLLVEIKPVDHGIEPFVTEEAIPVSGNDEDMLSVFPVLYTEVRRILIRVFGFRHDAPAAVLAISRATMLQ